LRFNGDSSWVTGRVLYVDGGFMAAGMPMVEGLEQASGVD
jgi:hypothetical protein